MKLFIKTFAGHIDVLDLDVAPSQLERIKAEILEESGAPPEHCLYFPDAKMWDGSKLSEHILALAHALDRPALIVGGVASRPGEGSHDAAGGLAYVESAATGIAAAVGAKVNSRSAAGYARPSDADWLGLSAGNDTSGNSDGCGPRGGAAALKATPADGKGYSLAFNGQRSDEAKTGTCNVLVGVSAKEAKLVSDHLEFRWVGDSNSKRKWMIITNVKKNVPVPSMVQNADNELPTCLLFPGEGCQYQGMCSVVRYLPGAMDLIKRASDVLGYDVMELCTYGPSFRMTQTRHCQPLIFISSLAALEKLKVLRPQAVARDSVSAGFGVGQFAALCAAGVLGFEDMLRLVQIRAEAMEEVCRYGKQLMLCVTGVDKWVLTEICLKAEQAAGPRAVCRIAHHCMPSCYSLGGTEEAILLAKDMAERKGASMVRILDTQVASETDLMAPAGSKFFAALEDALPRMQPPSRTVWSTVGPRPFHAGCSPREIVEDLKAHLTAPCQWEKCVLELSRRGIGRFYELGPRAFLKSMITYIDRKLGLKVYDIKV